MTFISRMVVARSFSSSFMLIYRIASWVLGIITYSSALTRRRVFSISSAISWADFSISASFKSLRNTFPSASTAKEG